MRDSSHVSSGFTGHEQLTEVGLVHMNGRGYDPILDQIVIWLLLLCPNTISSSKEILRVLIMTWLEFVVFD
jgi:hypothetical protein